MNRRSFLAGLLGTVITPALPKAVTLLGIDLGAGPDVTTVALRDTTAEWTYTSTTLRAPAVGTVEGFRFSDLARAVDAVRRHAIKPIQGTDGRGYYAVVLPSNMLWDLQRPLTAREWIEIRVREMLEEWTG